MKRSAGAQQTPEETRNNCPTSSSHSAVNTSAEMEQQHPQQGGTISWLSETSEHSRTWSQPELCLQIPRRGRARQGLALDLHWRGRSAFREPRAAPCSPGATGGQVSHSKGSVLSPAPALQSSAAENRLGCPNPDGGGASGGRSCRTVPRTLLQGAAGGARARLGAVEPAEKGSPLSSLLLGCGSAVPCASLQCAAAGLWLCCPCPSQSSPRLRLRQGYTLVSSPSRRPMRSMFLSRVALQVISLAHSEGNQPLWPSRSRSPSYQPVGAHSESSAAHPHILHWP